MTVPHALPPAPPAAEIVVTGNALPEARGERAYAVARIDRRQIEQSPSHELDQLLKAVPGLQLFRRSDARSGHPTSQGVTLRARDASPDLVHSINLCADELAVQVKRHRDKRRKRRESRAASAPPDSGPEAVPEDISPAA